MLSCKHPLLGMVTALLLLTQHAAWACMGAENVNFRLYPEYCRLKCAPQNTPADQAGIKKWEKLLGPSKRGTSSFLQVHHFCGAMMFQRNGEMSLDKTYRRSMYHRAIGDYRYVIRAWGKDALLYPEALVRLGKVQEAAGNPAEAAPAYVAALKARPKYPPAYAAYSDFLARQGRAVEAKKVLAAGLKHNPQSKLLHARFRALGGKQ